MGWFDNAVGNLNRVGAAVITGGLSEVERSRGSKSVFRDLERGTRDAAGNLAAGTHEFITGDKAKQAALDAERAAANDANATQKYIYDQNRQDAQPWREAGGRALPQLESSDFQRDFTMSDFQADPGYAFRMAEGQKAIERSAAARGGLNSGATMKALTRFGQDTASQEYQNAYNRFNQDRDRRFGRLSQLAGIGQTATGQTMSAGQNYGNNVSANQIGYGNAVASANIAQANRNAGLLNTAITGGAIAFSDARLKTNVEPVSRMELNEMKRHLKAYRFNYKSIEHGVGDWVGVMAQDLEKSKIGRTLVVENERGEKQISIPKVMSLFLATMAEG